MRPYKQSWTVLLPAFFIFLATSHPCWPVGPGENAEYIEDGRTIWREPHTGMEFVWLAGGCFKMGQDAGEKQELIREIGFEKYQELYSDELPLHQVCLDGFWLGRREVTQGQWLALMPVPPFPPGQGKDQPAGNISWNLAQQYIAALNRKSPEAGFRLPTEAEWEFAARGGTTTPFHTGKTITTAQANYNGIHTYDRGSKGLYRAAPLPVGSLPANSFGIFDMAGNLWEWCADRYSPSYYSDSPTDNPTGPEKGNQMVMRGGSWFTAPRTLRAANRRGLNPAAAVEDYGFRLACDRPPPKSNALLLDQNF